MTRLNMLMKKTWDFLRIIDNALHYEEIDNVYDQLSALNKRLSALEETDRRTVPRTAEEDVVSQIN